MSYKLTWMPDVLLKAGVRVAECEGWRERGRAEMGRVRGVMVHHTATPGDENMPTLTVLERGRKDLKGPLANLGLGRDGTFYVVAAGRANHAGPGRFRDIDAGNSSFIGIEAEHVGDPKVEWPPAQKEAYARGVAALLKHIDAPVDMCVAHKEWAPKRKIDPCFDMARFRSMVAGHLNGAKPPEPVPAADGFGRPTLRRGSEGEKVEELQELLDVRADGDFGPKTEAALRAWQRGRGRESDGDYVLKPDGVCGPKTWAQLLNRSAQAAAPAAAPVNGGLNVGRAGVDLIHEFEGCARRNGDGRFRAYPDPGSRTGKPWTIGWGSTGKGLDGQPIGEGTVWTEQQCDDHFNERIKRYVADVHRALQGAPTTQHQFDALVSFHYNTGAIAKATLTKHHRAGRFDHAEAEFAKWVRNDGKIMAGLIRRRQAEADLYAGR